MSDSEGEGHAEEAPLSRAEVRCLVADSVRRIQVLVASWRSKKSCTKRELLSLIGLLQHACRVVRSGRSFLRRMINLSTVVSDPHHHIWLNKGFRSDLEWWAGWASWAATQRPHRSCHYGGCVRHVGVCGLHRHGRLVPACMGGGVEVRSHNL